MSADIKLSDAEIILESQTVTLSTDASPATSTALNFRNPTGFWHLSGPRTYEPGNAFSVFWNDNSNWIGPMLTIQTGGNVGVSTLVPKSQLHVHGGEVWSTGAVAGFSFMSRDLVDGIARDENRGERFVWYAQGGSARLWSNTDLVTVTELLGGQANLTVHGTIESTFLKVNGLLVDHEIRKLRTEVAELKAAVAALMGK